MRRPLVTDRVVLAGDAAGFVDPLYGEGIAYAIRSGQIAAEVIRECLVRNAPCSAAQLGEYARRCDVEFRSELADSLRLSRLMYAFPGVFLKALASNRAFLERYLEVPLRRSSYREFLRWLVPRLPWCCARSLFG
jgi:flavin-dependent dehydrogenase